MRTGKRYYRMRKGEEERARAAYATNMKKVNTVASVRISENLQFG